MGAYKGDDARYDIVSTRLTGLELRGVQMFAEDRGIGITAAVRLLLNVGLEYMSGGVADGSEQSVQVVQVGGSVLHAGSGE
jgi:hypothetical protein